MDASTGRDTPFACECDGRQVESCLPAELRLCIENFPGREDRPTVFADHLPLDCILPELPAAAQAVKVRLDERIFLGVDVVEFGHVIPLRWKY